MGRVPSAWERAQGTEWKCVSPTKAAGDTPTTTCTAVVVVVVVVAALVFRARVCVNVLVFLTERASEAGLLRTRLPCKGR